jgi:predicted lactoylglutathione lyase
MKTKQIWFNLPVKDIQKSKAFYKEIGFKPNPMHENADHLASFFIGEKEVVMMLFPEDSFRHFTNHEVSDTRKGTEILLNIDAQSREEVDEMCQIVRNAGGEIYTEPMEAQGWMYAFGFKDPDGHRWAVLHMDMSKMPHQ